MIPFSAMSLSWGARATALTMTLMTAATWSLWLAASWEPNASTRLVMTRSVDRCRCLGWGWRRCRFPGDADVGEAAAAAQPSVVRRHHRRHLRINAAEAGRGGVKRRGGDRPPERPGPGAAAASRNPGDDQVTRR